MLYKAGFFYGSNKVKLYYQSWHPTDFSRGVIVGVHGHGDHSGGLGNIVQAAVKNGFTWYGFDLRGHGQSAGLRGHVDSRFDYLRDLQIFLDWVRQTEGVDSLFLLGHSLGGLLSLEYALRSPDSLQGIVAISPSIDFAGFSPLNMRLINLLSRFLPCYSIDQKFDYTKLTQDPAIIDKLAADRWRHDKMSLGLGREVIKSQQWVQSHPQDLRVPLLMLYGLDDAVTPAVKNQAFYNKVINLDKQQQSYEQTRHRPFDDLNRSQVLNHLSDWLDRHAVKNRTAPLLSRIV